MSLDPERTPTVYPVFLWLELSGQLERMGDGALAEASRQTMSGRQLGDDARVDRDGREAGARAGGAGGVPGEKHRPPTGWALSRFPRRRPSLGGDSRRTPLRPSR